MGQSTVDKTAVDIQRQFANYQDLTGKRRTLEDRMKKAESEKQTVKQHIFEKVFEEYRKEFRRLESEIEPLAKEVERARSSIRSQLEDIEIQTAEIQDERDELAFRHRIGEFDDKLLAEKESPLTGEYEQLTRRGGELSRMLAALEIREEAPAGTGSIPIQDSLPRDTTPVENSTSVAPVGSDGTARHEPIGGQSDEPPMPEPEAGFEELQPQSDVPESDVSENKEPLVDPTEWIDEFAREDLAADTARVPVVPGGPDDVLCPGAARATTPETRPSDPLSGPADPPYEPSDPLSELADPSDDSLDSRSVSEREDDGESADEGSLGGFPVLTITKGAGSGKKLPLLPMTMTLGRELDNNIELKDVDVARYHARISFEAGHYVIQDLEGSSGTSVNDKKITEATLCPGDTIRAGSTEMKFDLE